MLEKEMSAVATKFCIVHLAWSFGKLPLKIPTCTYNAYGIITSLMVMIKVFRHLCLPRCDRRDETEVGDAGDREARGGIQVRESRGVLVGGE